MAWFTYIQNNTGGTFDYDEVRGITHFVIIEASTPKEADDKLCDIGGYFDGVRNGYDCSCCGDRWYETYREEGTDEPLIYGKSPRDHIKKGLNWMRRGREVAIHRADGVIDWF